MNNPQNVVLQIEGMSCGHCVKAVDTALRAVSGVTVKQVAIGSAEIEFDAQQVQAESIREALDEAGYNVVVPQVIHR